jgi:uncharacterized iron-regulated protein
MIEDLENQERILLENHHREMESEERLLKLLTKLGDEYND